MSTVEPPSRERWRREVKAQSGKDPEGIGRYPFLGEPRPGEDQQYLERLGFPGEFPFTRGIQPTMYRGRSWTMRQYSGFGTVEETNQRFRTLLGDGQTGLSVAFDLPTQIGFDPDHPRARGEVGRVGVSISNHKDIARLFQDIPLDKVTVSMTINATSPILLGLMVLAGESRGIPRAKLGGTVQNDILKEFTARGTYIYPPVPSMRLAIDVIEFATREMPLWNSISVSGYHMREAGATAAQEIAFTIADAMAYARAAQERGLDLDDFLPRVSFFFSSSIRILEEVAKFRAARRLWAHIARDELGARSPRSQMLRFHTQTAGSSLTAQQPELNVIRTTIEALAGVLGGTQSLHTNAMDEALGLPTEASARLALRTQQVIAEESGVANTVDPVGGAWAIEEMTDILESEARAYLVEIEKMGGAVAAIERGFFQEEIAKEAYRTARALESGEEQVVGVTEHPETEKGFYLFPEGRGKKASQGQKIPKSVEERAVRSSLAFKKGRKKSAVETALSDLTTHTQKGENVMPWVIRALKEGGTLGEISAAWRELYGEHHPRKGI
jgi:methylmalonyl-CoA mutase N-terminal domain/subunit